MFVIISSIVLITIIFRLFVFTFVFFLYYFCKFEGSPKYHFFATEIDYKIQTNNKKILAGNWCHNHSTLEKEKSENIEIIKDCWENYDQKSED